MRRIATTLCALLLLCCFTEWAGAQDEPQRVTVREINKIPDANIEELKSGGEGLTFDEINALARSALAGDTVAFTAVLLSDPLNSGLASVSQGRVGRIHVFMRDTSAAAMGPEGMTIQVVDNNYENTGLFTALPGEVWDVVGRVTYFGQTVQIDPLSLIPLGPREEFNLPASIMDPVVVTTGDANQSMGDGRVQVNWDNYSDLNNQYVRFEAGTMLNTSTGDRPNWEFTSDGGQTRVGSDDISLRFRNDRAGYPDDFNKRDPNDPFIPPPPGSLMELEGFLTFRGTFDPFNVGVPPGGFMKLVAWEDDDMVVLESPPVLANMTEVEGVPGAEPMEVTFLVEPSGGRTIQSVMLNYVYASSATDTTQVAMTHTGSDMYTGSIPAPTDGDFVSYFVRAVDSEGATSVSGINRYRVLYDGIQQIAHVQETATGGPGPSPFTGMTIDMDITGVVQTTPSASGLISIQDDEDLAPWTGVRIWPTEALLVNLNPGDRVRITRGTIIEDFGLTFLRDITYDQIGEGEPYPYKEVTTGLLQDAAIAEAHESMMLRFNNVRITNMNPDAPSDFAEWEFASVVNGDVQDPVRGDDQSQAIPVTFRDENLELGQDLSFIQGVWAFTFSNYKVLPEVPADVAVGVSTEPISAEVPGTFALHQNFPNPFNPTTVIRYDVPVSAHVNLAIYDMLGRRVATLVDENLSAGEYQVRFDALDLSSGMYIYRIQAGEYEATKRMMFIK